jgi:hypothetical protein
MDVFSVTGPPINPSSSASKENVYFLPVINRVRAILREPQGGISLTVLDSSALTPKKSLFSEY